MKTVEHSGLGQRKCRPGSFRWRVGVSSQCHWLGELVFFHHRIQKVESSLRQDGREKGWQEKPAYLLVFWGCCQYWFGLGEGEPVRWLALSWQQEKVVWEGLDKPQIDSTVFLLLWASSPTFILPVPPPICERLMDLWIPTPTETCGRFLLATPSHHPTLAKEFLFCIFHFLITWDYIFGIIFDSFPSWNSDSVVYESCQFYESSFWSASHVSERWFSKWSLDQQHQHHLGVY